MSDLSNNSFIPKRGPSSKKRRGAPSRQVYVFTLVSYILMFATLIATGGVYLYGSYVDKQLSDQVTTLNDEIADFSESDMQKVLEFDLRLTQASDRLDNSVSILSVFEALEVAVIDTVQILSLDIEREGDELIVMEASIETDNFDSTIFQRGVYNRSQVISNVTISDVRNINNEGAPESNEILTILPTSVVTFKATLDVPLSAVSYVPQRVRHQATVEQSDIFKLIDADLEEDSLEGNENDI